MFAIYDCGADYLTREKHRLVVIANCAWGRLLNLSCYYDEILEKQKIPLANRKLMMIWTKCPLLRGSLKIFLKSK